jgi:GT2 family glycosyltransferase
MCLRSIVGCFETAVYVDSGSTDGSVLAATRAGCDVIELDMSTPFTAARARNLGFDLLLKLRPDIQLVHFIDGDCELAVGWIDKAVKFMEAHPKVAIVCGRRREREPGQSVYNMLCDLEWNTPIGEATSCGGDALVRISSFKEIGRFRPDVIAGEEPELCVRLRAAGWRVWRLDEEMTIHDAAMTRFSQWWRRAVRCGYAFAQGAHLHGAAPERHFVRESRRAWLWGIWLPIACLVAGLAFGPWGWATLLIFPLQALRLAMRNAGTLRQRAQVAIFQVLARFPEVVGQMKFLRDRLFQRQTVIIEYK